MARTLTGRTLHRYGITLLVALCVACGKPTQPEPAPGEEVKPDQPGTVEPEPTETEAHAVESGDPMATCVAGCERRDMARAIDHTVITAECRTWCASTPVADQAQDLDLLVGL